MDDQMKNGAAAYGCFLIIPLKYERDSFKQIQLEKIGRSVPVTTMDLNENIKAMLSPGDETAAGTGYIISRDALTAQMISGEDRDAVKDFRVVDKSGEFTFELSDSWLYVFRTRVAFLCLNLSFNKIETLQAICNPGWAYNPAEFFWNDPMGESHPFSVEKWLSDFLSPLGIQKFFDGESSYLLDSYTYIFTVVPQWFENLEQMRKPVFNLHKMMPLDIESEDEAEEDIRYVYAARNQEKDAYRWGCCVTSQTISYIVADEAMDFEAERRAQASDGLPVVLLALYEKYTCLRFAELTRMNKGKIKELKELMLNFQAFGTVTPANLSRWHNVKQIYANLLEVNDIPAAIEDISTKLNILTAHQEAVEHARSETIINLITIFGIVSILASVLSIVQILADGDLLIWVSTILTTIMLALVTALAIIRR
ncbi:hypothetical protein [Mediterraneibacter glycyrrhizinilyticus]|uniref:hypothetical protein n=1 Tax=Mediterraneibacter glycyrrhizinilyticus TaxID=342942 RepID=UPI0025A42817|nr:hypothetical protein [Mediterraneibacter glycyrrhizinilyticus]MDM8209572.1 hypothetical protein [Mediterraneibacter glycyrrhizinilyticus]